MKESSKDLPQKEEPKKPEKPAEVIKYLFGNTYLVYQTVAPTGGFGDFMAKQKEASKNKWVCDTCMMSNDASLAKCPACEAPNPKMAAEKVMN